MGAALDAMRHRCWHECPKVGYGGVCLLGDARLAAAELRFRQLAHAVPLLRPAQSLPRC